MSARPPLSPLFPYTTLFRSDRRDVGVVEVRRRRQRRDELASRERERVLDRQQDVRARRRAAPLDVQRAARQPDELRERGEADRKSTRLNSSHVEISYAVFCL